MTRFSGLVLSLKLLLFIRIKLCVRIAADFTKVVASHLDIACSYTLWFNFFTRYVEFTCWWLIRVICCSLAHSSRFVISSLVLWWYHVSCNFSDLHWAWYFRLNQHDILLLGTTLFLSLLADSCTACRLVIFTIILLFLPLLDRTIFFI